ncbi:hypothetical protein ACFV0B_35885 [Streptomyces xanthophaeus]|uniref:hypothetical protein n=1 Tax=Streptomyces xanthophaeus TaxID=67385 RepID=UPI0036A0E024
MLAVGLGLGMIGAPLRDLALAQVAPHHAGSASGLFDTATQLGIALGTASADSLWYVTGTLIRMWALMFLLPKRAHQLTQQGDGARNHRSATCRPEGEVAASPEPPQARQRGRHLEGRQREQHPAAPAASTGFRVLNPEHEH